DPVGQQARRAALEDVLRGEDDVALDAAARHGAGELAALAHDELRPDRSRRGAPRRDDGGDGDLLTLLPPAVDLRQQLLHVLNRSSPGTVSARDTPSEAPRPRGGPPPYPRARDGRSRARTPGRRSRARRSRSARRRASRRPTRAPA